MAAGKLNNLESRIFIQPKENPLELEIDESKINYKSKNPSYFRIRTCMEDVKHRAMHKVTEFFGSDWLYLALLGFLMGIFSFTIDVCIELLRHCQKWLFEISGTVTDSFSTFLQYFVWVGFTLLLILCSAALCHYIAPQAVGSGIPHMKTILRGVVLKEYLTFRTLVAKFLGLILALGCGLPIGKEGPFVHIASILATLLSRLVVSFKGIYEVGGAAGLFTAVLRSTVDKFQNESRSSEMLAAACAVGVAGTYGAPVGGVLFSIEVTSVFFPLRNYWRGFFSTVCSAITFRLLTVWFHQEDTVVAFSRTMFPTEYPFDPKELIVFAAIGVLCGIGGALFILFHTKYVQFVGENKFVQAIIKKNHFIYPTVVTIIIASLRCPLGYGRYFAGDLTPRETLDELFCNFSWNQPVENSTVHKALVQHWSSDEINIFLILALYTVNMFWMTAVAITLPVPSGVFIPVFVMGAALGRLVGETMALIFPYGVRLDAVTYIVPGAYAIVGAAAFAGAVTHAISTAVIVFEITGQILYILPVILAVLLANAVCSRFQPSIYDSIIKLKHLPYLPRIPPTSSSVHQIYVDDIMQKDVKYISLQSTYQELKELLDIMPRLKAFPIVDRPSSLILLGSIPRTQLEGLMECHIGDKVRHAEARRRRWTRKPAWRVASVSPDGDINEDIRKSSLRRFRSQENLNIPAGNKEVQSVGQRQRFNSGPETNMLRCDAESKKHFLSNVGNKVQTWSKNLKRTLQIPIHVGHFQQEVSDIDLTEVEKNEWEEKKMNDLLNFDLLSIDPAPFQLVERTSLYKVHALFSLLALNRAYVTCLGRLVGVVALRELRSALEEAQNLRTRSKPARKLSVDSLEEKVLLGTSLGFNLKPSHSIPAKMQLLDGKLPPRDHPVGSSVVRNSNHSSGYDLSTCRDDFVSGDEIADDDEDYVTTTLRKLSQRNSKIEKE